MHVIAYSGGVDSSLVAALVHRAFEFDPRQQVVACTGRSAALPAAQFQLAQEVATHIGIPFDSVDTTEGKDENYIRNTGQR